MYSFALTINLKFKKFDSFITSYEYLVFVNAVSSKLQRILEQNYLKTAVSCIHLFFFP